MINRVGKFNYDTNTHSLPKNRINAFLNWKYQDYDINFNSRYIDGIAMSDQLIVLEHHMDITIL